MISKIATRLLYYLALVLLYILIKGIELTPIKLLYRISDFWAKTLIKVKKNKINKVTQRNLRRVYNDCSPEEIRQLAYRYYSCFIDYLFEFVKQRKFSNSEMLEHCHFSNLDLLREKFKEHKFVICYAGHLLNFEWLVSFPLSMHEYGMFHLYQATQKNKMLEWVLNTRGRFGAINIPTTSPLRDLLEQKKKFEHGTSEYKGIVFGTLADMDINDPKPYTSKMFGYDFEVMTGSERIGRKMNMAFVYAHISRPYRGYYNIDFFEISPPDKEVNPFAYTDEFLRLLEKNINEQPELWMQWGECRF